MNIASPMFENHGTSIVHRLLINGIMLSMFVTGMLLSGCSDNNYENQLSKAVKLIEDNNPTQARPILEHLTKEYPDKETPLYYLAISLRDEGNAEEAIQTLEKIIAKNPQNGTAHITVASLLRKTKKYDKAIHHALAATKIDASNGVFLNELGVSYSAAGKTKEALSAYDKVLQTDPDNGTTLYNSGKLYLRQKHYQRAEIAFRKALNLKPDNAMLLFLLGETTYALGKAVEAKKLYNTIIALNPPELSNELGRVDFQLGKIYLEEQSYKSSASSFSRALKKKYSIPRSLFYLGRIAYEESDFETALGYFNRISPTSYSEVPEVSYYLGLTLFEKKLYNESLESLQEALLSKLPKAPILTRMGLCYLSLQNSLSGTKKTQTSKVLLDKADDLFKEALKKDPDNIKAMMGIGRVLYKRGTPGKALEVMNRINAISGGYSRADLLASLCYYESGDRNNAAKFAQKYINHHPEDSKVIMYLAQIELESGNDLKARLLLKSAIKHDETNWNAMLLLSTVCSEQGRFIEAAEILLNILNEAKEPKVLKKARELYDYITKPFRELLFPERKDDPGKLIPGSKEYVEQKLAPAMALRDKLKTNVTRSDISQLMQLTRELVVDYKFLKSKKLFTDEANKTLYRSEIRNLVTFVKECH